MADLGRLVVNLEANIAEFTRNMNQSAQTTTDAMNRINGALDTVKAGLAALGVGAAVGTFANIVQGSIDAADNLRDMSQKVGVAVEELNGLGFASGQAGGSLDAMGAAAGKLNKTITEAASGNADAVEAFKALDISVTDAEGNLKKADVVMGEVADKFAEYQDGPEKSAIALRLFSKAGADMIPLLNDGGDALRENVEYAKRYSYATTELSNMADNYNDTLGKLRIQQQGFTNQLSAELLPIMQSVADAFLNASEKANDLHSWSSKTADVVKYLTGAMVTQAYVAEQWGIKLGGATAKARALASLDWKGFKAIGADTEDALDKARGDYLVLYDEIQKGGKKDWFATPMATVEKLMVQEREILASRNAMVNKYQSEGLMSQKDANAARLNAQTEYVSYVKALYGEEIKILSSAKKVAAVDENNPAKAQEIQDRIDGLYRAQALVGTEKPAAPKLAGAAQPDKTGRIELAGQIREMEAAYAQVRDEAKFHQDVMAEMRAQDMIDVETYEQFKIEAIRTGAGAAEKHYDDEIKALTKARDATADAAAKAQLTVQINDKLAQKDKARTDATNAVALATLGLSAAQSDLNQHMQDWARQQDSAIAQQQFANDLQGKSTVEVIRLTAAKRAQLEVEEAIRRAKERGTITPDSIAKFTAAATGKAQGFADQSIRGEAQGLMSSLQTPAEAESKEHANRLAILQAYREQEFADTAAANQALERENERHEQTMYAMRVQWGSQAVQMASDSSAQLYDVLKEAGMEQTALGKALFFANKALKVAEMIMNTEAAATQALELGPIAGPIMAGVIRGLGYASVGTVIGTTIASAEGGYDIPAGMNPVTQLHEKEMVLPKAQAEVIRGLAANGGAGGRASLAVTYSPNFNIDSRSDRAQVQRDMQMVAQQANADLVDRLQRAGRI